MITLDELGRTVRQARKQAKLSQPELAERAGVSRALIAKLETRRLGELGVVKLRRILNVLRLDLRVTSLNQHRPTLDDLRQEDAET